MPSPFPGMDPFLENPGVFPDVHDSLITYLRESPLNTVLPPAYRATIASRVWLEASQRPIGPDAKVLHRAQPVNGGAKAGAGAGGVAIAEALATEPIAVEVETEEEREILLEIYAEPGARLVTAIEVLSPTNKSPAGHGRGPYLQKQREVLQSQVHLVEIDLLRGGVHATAVPLRAAVAAAGSFDYHVCVHRWDRPNTYYIYPIQLQGRLPLVAAPLLPDDPPVMFNLKAVLERAYDAGRYSDWVPYRDAVPAPPLHPSQAEWVEQTLRAAGLRETPPAAPTA